MSEKRLRFAKEVIYQNGTTTGTGKLYGREDQENVLVEAYKRSRQIPHESSTEHPMQQLVLISGPGGTGKTALANTLRHKVVTRDKGFFVSGKFEQTMMDQDPYEVFVSALTQYTDQFLDFSNAARVRELRDTVMEEVGPEAGLLTEVIPALQRLLGQTDETSPAVYGTDALHRFRIVFCNLIRVLAKNAPLVMLVDDLQWADTLSTELLRALLHTPDMPLLVICAYRCSSKQDMLANPMSASMRGSFTSFADLVHALEQEQRSGVGLVKIELADLNAHDVNVWLADRLRRSEQETERLAEVICAQTHGNIFHAIQFLQFLVDQGLLQQNENEVWEWDDGKLSGEIESNETIVDLVRRKIEGMPHQLREALKVASCIGNDIDDSALDLVLVTSTAKSLELAAEEGLVVFYPEHGGYRFAHDWIRQTAFQMIPEEELPALHAKIGRRLWKSSSAAALDKNLFVVVSLLNKGISAITEERELFKIAKLNLMAGEKAIAVAAFPNASRFLHKGIQLLGTERWKDRYALSLALYNTASEVDIVNGNFERGSELIEVILREAVCLDDKLRAYTSLIRRTALQQNFQKALMIGLDVFKQLGESLPAKATPFSIAVELLKVKFALRGKTNEDLLSLPPMQDSTKIASARMLNLMVAYCYHARSPYTTLVAFRSLLLTLRYGLHKGSGLAFSLYGMVLCGLGWDVKGGFRFGQLGISLAESPKRAQQAKQRLPLIFFVTGATINHWTQPVKDSLVVLKCSAEMSMEVGDVEAALLALHVQSMYSALLGLPLHRAEELALEGIRIATLHRIESTIMTNRVILQLIECWTGRAKNPARLSGSVVEFDVALAYFREIKNNAAAAALHMYAMILTYTFCDYDYAGELAEYLGYLRKSHATLMLKVEARFIVALTVIALLRTDNPTPTANRKIAKRALKSLSKWAKDSPRSYTAKQKIVEAELLSLKRGVSTAACLAVYQEAIDASVEEGYTRDAAIAHERTGDFKHARGDTEGAIDNWRRATCLYDEWGAIAKSEQLEAYCTTFL